MHPKIEADINGGAYWLGKEGAGVDVSIFSGVAAFIFGGVIMAWRKWNTTSRVRAAEELIQTERHQADEEERRRLLVQRTAEREEQTRNTYTLC